jgi:hypothetical protein
MLAHTQPPRATSACAPASPSAFPRLCDAAFLISLATPWPLTHTRVRGHRDHQVTYIDGAQALKGLTTSAIELAQRMIDPRRVRIQE